MDGKSEELSCIGKSIQKFGTATPEPVFDEFLYLQVPDRSQPVARSRSSGHTCYLPSPGGWVVGRQMIDIEKDVEEYSRCQNQVENRVRRLKGILRPSICDCSVSSPVLHHALSFVVDREH